MRKQQLPTKTKDSTIPPNIVWVEQRRRQLRKSHRGLFRCYTSKKAKTRSGIAQLKTDVWVNSGNRPEIFNFHCMFSIYWFHVQDSQEWMRPISMVVRHTSFPVFLILKVRRLTTTTSAKVRFVYSWSNLRDLVAPVSRRMVLGKS